MLNILKLKIMISVKIEIDFNTQTTTNKEQITIPHSANVRFTRDNQGKLYFAYEIRGHLYRPQLEDILLFQRLYDCKSYKCLSEYLKGETLVMIKTTF